MLLFSVPERKHTLFDSLWSVLAQGNPVTLGLHCPLPQGLAFRPSPGALTRPTLLFAISLGGGVISREHYVGV